MKRSVILTDRLGPDILSAFWTKGQVLHRERAHLKVRGFSIVLNALLTRKLATFLSRLNEISGGCEKNAPVSGSFWSISKLLRMIAFTGLLRGWNVRVNGILSFFSFCDVCSADCRSILLSAVMGGDLLWRRANARNVSFSISVRWSIYIINSVDKPNFCVSLPHRRSTTVSLETNPLYNTRQDALTLQSNATQESGH